MLQGRHHVVLQYRPEELAITVAQEACVDIHFANIPQNVPVGLWTNAFMTLHRDSAQMVEVLRPHHIATIVCVHRYADIVDEEQEVAQEYSV